MTESPTVAHAAATASLRPADEAAPAKRSAQRRMREIQHDIIELILDSDLDVGDPMPTELELCARLGVGRNSLREALKVLQALGVVEIRHGFGTFVAETSLQALAGSLAFRGRLALRSRTHNPAELVDVRQALEAGLIGQAMDVMSLDDLADIRRQVERMEHSAHDPVAFASADQEFHRALYRPLGNELLSGLLDVFWSVYREVYSEAHGAETAREADTADAAETSWRGSTAQHHREIYEAIVAGDRALAAERLSAHFDGIRRLLRDKGAS